MREKGEFILAPEREDFSLSAVWQVGTLLIYIWNITNIYKVKPLHFLKDDMKFG